MHISSIVNNMSPVDFENKQICFPNSQNWIKYIPKSVVVKTIKTTLSHEIWSYVTGKNFPQGKALMDSRCESCRM